MIGLVVTFTVMPGHEGAFDELLATVLAGIRAHEPGTVAYARAREATSPGTYTLLEVYRDEAALRAHEAEPHTRAFVEAREDHLAASIEVRRLVVDDLAQGPAA